MLIHFTKELSNIISILESSSFMLGYCSEYFGEKNQIVSSAAHPMVCFSEFTDSELSSKTITYGKYAIAMKKTWAITNELSPVLYIERNSQAAVGLASLLKARQKHGKDAIPKNLRLPIMQIKCFTKHETGYNSYFDHDNFCFKDENEWRYIPTKEKIGGGYISLNRKTFINNKEKYNNRLKPYPLRFEYSDIEFIYVKTDEEIKMIIEKFNQLKSKLKHSEWTLQLSDKTQPYAGALSNRV
ncbi:Putative abortive phage resistance protein AbiGi, antitoxin [Thiothrix eikelboomii]|uniref:Putative abortive phage resistance protein AbiGi, antitoxin n=1 Tax=Thiothrix eikelboomii TaxID=92487 RepID=A0A1T4XXB5_9GAMM|nr:abortive infection system antitoxin AbiGi family protein [Thiothrix eikelboomii]SKA94219.1 Putative abortive phage resistance protein AbiGi, antitoxin [Thiothrix eikelboomii]